MLRVNDSDNYKDSVNSAENEWRISHDIKRQLVFSYFHELGECLPLEDYSRFKSLAFHWFLQAANPDLLESLHALSRSPESRSHFLLKNLPVDIELPRTPEDGVLKQKKNSFLSEALLLSIGTLLGQVISYRKEKEGRFVHDICPIREKKNTLSNAGSTVNFGFHTETASFQTRPDFIILYCLRSDRNKEARTKVADVEQALKLLSEDDIEQLEKRDYQLKTPASFSQRRWSEPLSVLSGPCGQRQIRVNFNFIRAADSRASIALKKLEWALARVSQDILLEPGEMLIINNRKAVHARTPFKAFFDGYDRWLQRVYVRTDLWQVRDLLEADEVTYQ